MGADYRRMLEQSLTLGRAARTPLDVYARRGAFVVLLVAAPLLPHMSSGAFDYPGVSAGWVCLPLCALLVLPLLDLRAPSRWLGLDVLMLLSLLIPFAIQRPWSTWQTLLFYPPLAYLAARMIGVARSGPDARPGAPAVTSAAAIPRRWLVIGIAVLAAVHVSWAVDRGVFADFGAAGVNGALSIVHGRALYGGPGPHAVLDPHLDTYGPLNYELYVPLALTAPAALAARLTALFFDLLTAVLLFALGRQVRGARAGVLLAYAWLAFPLALYGDALAFNDSIVACALVGTVLVARSPARRGAMAAMAAWTKLIPLALLPLLIGYRPAGGGRDRRGPLLFVLAFAAATMLVFVPAVTHSSLSTFVSRTIGNQVGRPPEHSIWSVLQTVYAAQAAWIGVASRVLHGLLVASTGAFAVALLRGPRRQDAVGLAAASAALLIAIQAFLSYYSPTYILWFAPLVLVALILSAIPADAPGAAANAPGSPPTW